jgi:hypothetical protein
MYHSSSYAKKFIFDTNSRKSRISGRANLDIEVFIPIIVFDGRLYSWFDGHIEEENEILLNARCYTTHYYEKRLVSVVKKEHFKNFLQNINDDFINLYNFIHRNKSQFDKLATEIIG